jgi:N,N-dimethylformamidase
VWQAVDRPLTVEGVAAAWDFTQNLTKTGVRDFTTAYDTSPNRLHGTLVNSPTRAVTGYNWDGSEYDFRHAPEQYGAIHFHDDDLTDCGWEATCEFEAPADLPSGVYAARVRAHIEGVDEEDYISFFVRPPRGTRTSRIAYIAPTASYLAYANDLLTDLGAIEMLAGAVPHMGEQDLARHQHREYGKSLYDAHRDGSGVCYSSWLRPLLTVRPKYRHSASRVWQFNADLHLIDWLHRMGYDVDVVTDHDLHAEGASLLRGYKLAITGTHPEYYSGTMLDSVHAFLEEGGRVMYLGGNGFYWTTAFNPEDPRIVEVRRWGGTEAWTAEPGQHHVSFTGEMGGLWRNKGRAPQKLVGVGFIAQGLDRSTYFVRKPGGDLPETAWILDGIGPDERIGDFGLEQEGAAGVEIDWYDPRIGSPGWAQIVAASEGHSRLMLHVREDTGMTLPYMGGDLDPAVRADMVYFKTRNDGAVFSSSSISWCGSLSHDDYENNVSRIMRNVVDRFVEDGPLP